ncbi:MAG: S8 family serine peptidase [Leadbetterella sp.]
MRALFTLLCLMIVQVISGQNRYFVYLKDKKSSSFSVNNPEKYLSKRSIDRRVKQNIRITQRDLPVDNSYINQISAVGAKVIGTSKWLNAVLIEATPLQHSNIQKLSFYLSTEAGTSIKNARVGQETDSKWTQETFVDFNYGNSLVQNNQMGVDLMHKNNFTGKGILLGVFDSGFDKADVQDYNAHVFANKRIVDTYDFVAKEKNVYDDHNHGANVLSAIVGLKQGSLIGTAPDVDLVLYRTEDVYSETRIEEVYWLFAAERADSIGVDIINSSLGYYEFDDTSQNYKYSDMTGDKTIASRAADFASSVGILVVVSVGNEGSSKWRYLCTPADADSVISVGAINDAKKKSGFSSFGPNAKKQTKPEVVAKGEATVIGGTSNNIGTSNGTSFSAPLVAGFVANLMQEFPNIPAMELRKIILNSSSIATTPNDSIGHGIPSYTKASALAKKYLNTEVTLSTPNELPQTENQDLRVYPNPFIDSERDFKIRFKQSEISDRDEVKIFSSAGKLEISDVYKNVKTKIAQLKPGKYEVLVQIQGKLNKTRFIKL